MTGLVIALIGAAFWAGLDVTRKYLVRGMEPVAAAGWMSLLNAPVFLAWALLASDAAPSPGYWLPGGTAALLQIAANVLFFRALFLSPLSLTIPFPTQCAEVLVKSLYVVVSKVSLKLKRSSSQASSWAQNLTASRQKAINTGRK